MEVDEAASQVPEATGQGVRSIKEPKRLSGETQKSKATAKKPGRGGAKHKYLQELLKKTGEHLGMRASIEESILDGRGSVDVALESSSVQVACEVSISSEPDYELRNVEKCLSAGFDHVIVISPEPKKLQRLQGHISAHLDEAVLPKVHFLAPEDALILLEEIAIPETEETIGGYKVSVRYRGAGDDERAQKRQAVADMILKALKRLKDEG